MPCRAAVISVHDGQHVFLEVITVENTSHHRLGEGPRTRLRRQGAAAGLPAGEEPAPGFTAIDAYIRRQM